MVVTEVRRYNEGVRGMTDRIDLVESVVGDHFARSQGTGASRVQWWWGR